MIDTKRGQRRVVVALGLTAVAVLVAGTLVVLATRPSNQVAVLSSAPSPAPVAPLPARQRTAPDGGELRIVEQGFTQLDELVGLTLTPGYGPGHPEHWKPVRSAIIVENTSRTQIALFPKILTRYLDPAGKAVIDYGASSDSLALTTTAIFPGERVGITGFLNIDDLTVARLEVTPVDAAWSTPAQAGGWVSKLAATQVRMVPTGSAGSAIFAFTVHSDYPAPVSAVANAIYRDQAGHILGGSDTSLLDALDYPPGTAPGSITVTDWLPPNLDPSRTEVYLSRGA